MKKVFKPIVILFAFISFFILSIYSNDSEKVSPTKATILKQGKIYSNKTLEINSPHKKYYSEEIGTVYSGQPIEILEAGGWETYKIRLKNGNMGWIDAKYIKPSKKTFVKFNTSGNNRHIASNMGAIGLDRKIVKEVNEKTEVTRLQEVREEKSPRNVINWTKVRTKEGIEGWIMSDYLFRVVQDSARIIPRKDWLYSLEGFRKSWISESIDDFTLKFKEPSGVGQIENQKVYYFNNIFLFDEHYEHYGIRVHVLEGKITFIDSGARKTSWISYMPLSSALRINLLSNYIGNWGSTLNRETDPNEKAIDITENLPNWAAYIVYFIIFILFLGILYLILEIPYSIVNRIVRKQSLNRKLFNRRIMIYAVFGSIILGYPFYVLVSVNIYPFNDYFWFTSLFCLGMLLGNIYKWRNDLDYNRCDAPSCHQWTGIHNGTEYLGGSTVTQRITYNGGGSETNTQTTRRYRDHRLCTACGNEWSIVRTEVIGKLKI